MIPGLGRYPGEENGYPLRYSCLENPWTEEPGRLHTVHGVVELDMAEQLSHGVHELERRLDIFLAPGGGFWLV